jgi:fluoroacetyl-CoA thioesterase
MTTEPYKVGDTIKRTQVVDESKVASHLGSGSLQVYATPAMVTFIEHTCRQLIESHLSEGQTSVGVAIHVKHLAPTPLGAAVSIQAEIVDMDGRFVTFTAQVRDESEIIGEAEHTRAVIDEERFLKRVASKS